MGIILAIIIFSVIIIIHEFGHFLLAKQHGITVTEFAVGMGPKLLSFKKGETVYALKLIPFGGSCMMLGEDENNKEQGAFGSKSVWARISVIVAGPIFNFILAFVLSVLVIGNIGYDKPQIRGVVEGYAADEAGMQAGDVIKKMNGKTIHFYREVSNYTSFHQGETVHVVYERDGQEYEATLVPKESEDGRMILGITGSSSYREKTNPIETLQYSLYEVKYWIETTIESLGMMLQGKVSLDDVSGPVGVVNVIGETYEESAKDGGFYVWINMLNISILLTANLGVVNLLPIPALDGGRLVFLIIEAIRGRRIDEEKEGMIHLVGMALLMVLMIVVMFNDVRKIF